MRFQPFALVVLGLICGSFRPGSAAGQLAAGPGPSRDRFVVVISLDGFPAESFQDPKVPAATLRSLAKSGASARSMRVVNPSVTWPNHTTLVTGVAPATHSVLYNGLAVRGGAGQPVRVEPWIDKAELVKAPTVYDIAHEAGLTTAEVDWVAIQNARSINWSFAEQPRPEGPVEKEMIAAGLITEDDVRNFVKAPITWRDEIWALAAIHIIEKHRPNLLLLHLLNTDSVQHRYGPGSLAGNTALALADRQVARVIEALRTAGISDRTTLVVVSDHGFKTYRRVMHPNAFLLNHGFIREHDSKLDCDAWVIPEGGTAMVYVTRPEKKTELVKELAQLFSRAEGIAKVIDSREYAQYGFPSPQKNEHMADLVLVAANGFSFENSTKGDVVTDLSNGAVSGSHGYLATDPKMNAILIMAGRGIKSGVDLGDVTNVEIAPTIANLLGLEMKNIEGRPLRLLIE